MNAVLVACLCLLSITVGSAVGIPRVYLTITAEKRLLQVVWYDLSWADGDRLLISNQSPPNNTAELRPVAEIKPRAANGWETTKIKFDYKMSRSINVNTHCYGYWVTYITAHGTTAAVECLRGHATWMNDLRPGIEKMRMTDLIIPGTHDAGSYKVGFNPGRLETLFTKYALAQDDDIRGQLMHGARYLDIRPSYFNLLRGKPFYVNHGAFRQRPMAEVVDQVRKFVLETKEIVIFGMKEFPHGFSNGVHMKFVTYLEKEFAGLIIDPALTWNVTLGELWKRKQYIFLAYDEPRIVDGFRTTLFPSVNQRWGNVDKWPQLEEYLRNLYKKKTDTSVPMADMAELTPSTKGTIFNKYGGLRRMADNVNSGVSNLYRNELGSKANIVAVDYLRGTTLAELAIELNKKRIN